MSTILRNKLAAHYEQIREAYQNGATFSQIAEVLNASSGTVRNILKEMGVPTRSRGRRRKEDVQDPRILSLDLQKICAELNEDLQEEVVEERVDENNYEGDSV